MKAVGLDPAFANFGMVAGDLVDNHRGFQNGWVFRPYSMQLVTTKGGGKHREVRKSSENLARGRELFRALHVFLREHQPALVFVEVPSGAQNANAAGGLGLAIGILASIQVPMIEVAPLEIKRLFTTRQQAVPKTQIMNWAYQQWPDAPWLMAAKKRTLNNEHLADACATVVAGLRTPTFQQLMALRGNDAVSLSDHDRRSSGGQPGNGVPVGAVPVDQRAGKTVRRKIDPSAW